MQSLKQEKKALRDKVEGTKEPQLSTPSAAPHPSGVPSRVTLPELRDIKDLVFKWIAKYPSLVCCQNPVKRAMERTTGIVRSSKVPLLLAQNPNVLVS